MGWNARCRSGRLKSLTLLENPHEDSLRMMNASDNTQVSKLHIRCVKLTSLRTVRYPTQQSWGQPHYDIVTANSSAKQAASDGWMHNTKITSVSQISNGKG